MRTPDLIAISVKNLGMHAFRSILTVLGIIFGVGALVAMLAIAEGARRKALENLNTLGIDNLVAQSVKPRETGGRQDTGQAQKLLVYGLTEQDRSRLSRFDNVRQVIGVRNLRFDIFGRGRKTDLQVLATEPGFLEASRSQLLEGRFFGDADQDQLKQVCVLGREASETLFPNAIPLGETVRLGGSWYRVVGIISTPSTLKIGSTGNLSKAIFIPYATAKVMHGNVSTHAAAGVQETVKVVYDALLAQVKRLEALEATADRERNVLAATHAKADVEVVVPYDLVKQSEQSQKTFSIVMGAIAGISLIVGGIGVTNIMLANVYERTREIGTCLALGAHRADILRQFLLEATTLALLGGLLGLATGVGMALAVTAWAGWETALTPLALTGALVIAGGIGVLAGTYPAYQASRLSPIEALRYE